MTRLTHDDIKNIPNRLAQYDRELKQKTGRSLRGIACYALGIQERDLHPLMETISVGVVPVRSGKGIISGFCEAVKETVTHTGFEAFVTRRSDVAGVAEAAEHGAQVVMMADDHRFIALDIHSGQITDNSEATAKGFVAALDLMIGGLYAQKVLVMGCGNQGHLASREVVKRGAGLSVFDLRPEAGQKIARDILESSKQTVSVETNPEAALSRHHLIIDATSTGGFIGPGAITEQTYISAPGMPLCLTPAALEKISDRLYHDPLQTGVAVMTVDIATKAQRNEVK